MYMRTYNVSIDENVMEQERPSITKGMDENAWVQQHVQIYFSQMAASRRKEAFDDDYMANLIGLSAPSWNEVGDADEWIHELRGKQ